jgi:AAA15 family ATPase/GTPase
MFIEFSVSNFRSFKTLQTLSLQAANIVSKTTNKEVDENNVITVSPKLKLLKSKAIYGANASGKSNIVKAILAFVFLIRHSVSAGNILNTLIKKYELSTENDQEPIFFQLIFTSKDTESKEIVYRYGFEIKDNEVFTEWLFGTPKRVEVPFFVREGMNVTVNERVFKGAKKFENLSKKGDNEIFRNNSLFLSAVSAMGVIDAKSLVEVLANINILSGLGDSQLRQFVGEKFKENNKDTKTNILRVLKSADLGIDDIFVEDNKQEDFLDKLPNELRELAKQGKIQQQVSFFSTRNKYDSTHTRVGEVTQNFDEWESEGTKKMLDLSLLLLRALDEGRTLIIDEFDARLHPLLTKKIIQLFNSNKTNPNNAQLIFVTHDASLLKANLLRRDQISLVRKDKFGSSTLKTLVEFKGTRNDASYEKEYLQGSYGAVPFLNNFEDEFTKS